VPVEIWMREPRTSVGAYWRRFASFAAVYFAPISLQARTVGRRGDGPMSYARKPLARALKRAMDVTGAAGALIATAPILAVSAVAIIVTMGRPIFFTQVRAGLDGKPFRIVKFRTMRAPKPGEEMYHTDAQRLTRVGRWLRKTSIDELPQLWNILVGDMSLVGPRPFIFEYVPLYDEQQRKRLDVVPGLTGWAQVSGRQTLKLSERLALDAWYVDNWSLWLDVKIIFKTVAVLLAGGGDVLAVNVDDVGFLTRQNPKKP
jgi:lipopolysaccharide/colanic/teichoic acid biosynthesis glycosyltransferase